MQGSALLTIAIAILGFGLFSRRLEGSFLTPPIAFVSLGFAAAGLGFLEAWGLDCIAALSTVHVLGSGPVGSGSGPGRCCPRPGCCLQFPRPS